MRSERRWGVGQHDGFHLACKEKVTVFAHDVHRNEIVHIVVGGIDNELRQRAEGVDGDDGYDLLYELLESQHGEGVGVDDCNFGSLQIHGAKL